MLETNKTSLARWADTPTPDELTQLATAIYISRDVIERTRGQILIDNPATPDSGEVVAASSRDHFNEACIALAAIEVAESILDDLRAAA